MPDEFVDTAVREIDDRLGVLKDEAARLEAARAVLLGGSRRRGRPPGSRTALKPARSAARRNGAPRGRGGRRAAQALELVRNQPGITIPELAQAMKIQPNYLYRVLPRLASGGDVRRDGQGWHPAASSATATETAAVRGATPRRRAKAAKPRPKAPASETTRSRKSAAPAPATTSRTARGATRTSVLAALAEGEAMTAGQVAASTGLARGTVSTTLSKLAKSGEIEKAQRGYRLASAAQAEPASPAE